MRDDLLDFGVWTMRILLVVCLLFAFKLLVFGQEFKYKAKASTVCQTAREHKHDDVVTVTMNVVSWDGCELKGVIHGKQFKGKTYTLFGGFEKSTKLAPRQKIKVQYDRSCGQVMFAVFPKDVGFR